MSTPSSAADGGGVDPHDLRELPITSPSALKPASHRKSRSSSIFSKLSLLQTAPEGPIQEPGKHVLAPTADDRADTLSVEQHSTPAPTRNQIMQSVFGAQSHARKRKGSLRKTALLGMRLDRRGSGSESVKRIALVQHDGLAVAVDKEAEAQVIKTGRNEPYSSPQGLVTDDVRSNNHVLVAPKLPLQTSSSELKVETNLIGPVTSATDTTAVTTDVVDGASQSPAASITPSPTVSWPPTARASPAASPPSSENSLALQHISARHRSTSLSQSPVASSPATAALANALAPTDAADWDYTETAQWGWVVLTATWVVFVVGMGSCLGVWSWAWDVGQTPWAPPELEDDPTLPIVGYYPALIILTAVVSWVWVVVAWVGMKYFKHAKMQGD